MNSYTNIPSFASIRYTHRQKLRSTFLTDGTRNCIVYLLISPIGIERNKPTDLAFWYIGNLKTFSQTDFDCISISSTVRFFIAERSCFLSSCFCFRISSILLSVVAVDEDINNRWSVLNIVLLVLACVVIILFEGTCSMANASDDEIEQVERNVIEQRPAIWIRIVAEWLILSCKLIANPAN